MCNRNNKCAYLNVPKRDSLQIEKKTIFYPNIKLRSTSQLVLD